MVVCGNAEYVPWGFFSVQNTTLNHTTVYQYFNTLIFFQYNIIPRGILSLKVLAELPIIVVLMYQLYKPNVHQEVAEFIPLIMNTITLQPSAIHK